MHAAFYERQGLAQEVLQIGELPDPSPGPGEVRVRVAVSGLNPSDTKGRSGWAGAQMPFPRIIPHQDGAGVVDRVGPGVPASRLGERVWLYEAQRGQAGGTAAEYTVVPSANAVALPDGIPFEVGACLGVPAMTAHRCLFADGSLDGRWVLVQGGAGAVGLASVLLAKWAGAHVAATVSRPEQERAVREAGADLVFNRRSDDIPARVRTATEGAGVARIIDVSLGTNLQADLACLAPNGVVSAYAADSADVELRVPFMPALRGGVVLRWVFVYTMPKQAHQDAARDITTALAAGAYRPLIASRSPLDQIAVAHDAQDSGAVVGKLLLDVAEAG